MLETLVSEILLFDFKGSVSARYMHDSEENNLLNTMCLRFFFLRNPARCKLTFNSSQLKFFSEQNFMSLYFRISVSMPKKIWYWLTCNYILFFYAHGIWSKSISCLIGEFYKNVVILEIAFKKLSLCLSYSEIVSERASMAYLLSTDS